jgi:Peptidase family M28/PDZ domain
MRLLPKIFIITSILLQSLFAQVSNDSEITSAEIKEHITFLASDELKGRLTGSEECRLAAEYIESDFKSVGLVPFFDNSYLQAFPVITDVELTANNKLEIKTGDRTFKPKLYDDFITLSFSGDTKVEGILVFAGYGISAPDIEYDDYAGIDVMDKIVLVLREHPEMNVPHSKFDDHSSLRKKATVARDKGATAIIFVNGYNPHKDDDELINLSYDQAGPMNDFAVINIKRNLVEKLFKTQDLDFKAYQSNIVDTKSPASFSFNNTKVSITTQVNEIVVDSWNVAGYLEGNDPRLQNEYIIIGAHFDHLGMGENNSLYRGEELQIHNGADDNASGTAGVLELAEKFSAYKDKLKRSIVFATFSGEEEGLLGSAYFVNNLPVSTEDIAMMINMDMIGRLNDDKSLIVYGTGTSSNFKDLLTEYNENKFDLTFNDEGYGPSDHSSFYSKKIPVLFFFTGTHEDYHKPSDDTEKINFAGEEEVLKYIYKVALDLDNTDTRPDYIAVKRKDSGNLSGIKVKVGTIPDFAGNVDGYKISGVSEGSPAQIAGLVGGDIIIEFGGKKISNIYDFTYALGDYVPGDLVNVVVKRGKDEIEFQVELAPK